MTTTTKKKTKDLQRAEDLMNQYAAANEHRQALLDSIMEELKGVEAAMKEKQLELIEIGTNNMNAFDEKGNLHFEKGYLHIAHNTKVITTKTFDLAAFAEAHPEMVDITLKTNPIKKAWLDKEQAKELRSFKVSVDTDKKVEVKLNKTKA